MKIGGVDVTALDALLVLPRPSAQDIPFRAKAVSINEEFNKMVPEPTAPMLLKKGQKVPDLKDKAYQEAVGLRDDKRFAFMVIKSLEPSNIEWESVKLDDPSTWLNWDEELKESGISETEVNRIVGLVMEANSLDESKIDAARRAFLLGLEAV